MFRKFLAVSIALFFIFNSLSANASQSVREGAACPKTGSVATVSKIKYTCKLVGKKRVWVRTPVAAPASPSTYSWKGPCQEDPFLEASWKPVQNYLTSIHYCNAPYSIVPASLTNQSPSSKLSGVLSQQDVSSCKAINTRGIFKWTGFPSQSDLATFNSRKHPSTNTIYQVLPIETLDAPSNGATPKGDYSNYIKYLKDYFDYISDTGSTVQFNVPTHYFKLNQKVADAKLTRDVPPNSTGTNFFKSALEAAKVELDLNSADMILLVLPIKTDSNLMSMQAWGREAMHQMGYKGGLIAVQPNGSLGQLGQGWYIDSHPSYLLHELFHAGIGLDDYYGSAQWKLGDDFGMGNWSLLATTKSDLTTWDKWLLGFIGDNQVICLKPDQTSTNWVVPNGTKSTAAKMIVIPIDGTKVIVIESRRNTGFDYKLPVEARGALAYVVDTAEKRHGYALKLLVPDGRTIKDEREVPMVGMDIPLKQGEYVSYGNFKISVVEAGVYGDVVKVEKK